MAVLRVQRESDRVWWAVVMQEVLNFEDERRCNLLVGSRSFGLGCVRGACVVMLLHTACSQDPPHLYAPTPWLGEVLGRIFETWAYILGGCPYAFPFLSLDS